MFEDQQIWTKIVQLWYKSNEYAVFFFFFYYCKSYSRKLLDHIMNPATDNCHKNAGHSTSV